jgi:cell division protein ZipA
MENSVRYILLAIGVFIILGILWDGLRRKKRQAREAPIGTIDLKRVKEKIPYSRVKPLSNSQSSSQSAQIPLPDPEDGIVSDVRSVGAKSAEPVHTEAASVFEQAMMQESMFNDSMAQEEEVVVAAEPTPMQPAVQTVKSTSVGPLLQDGFVMLHLKSSYEEGMGGYVLLQTLLANKLQFGANQFFHRYENNDPKAKVLFSISSNVAPGTFNPTAMKDFHCQGLVLFMNVEHHKKSRKVFEVMLETAESLAEALDADILINQDKPCDDAHLAQLRSELA